ncbi:MAG: DUF1684 domain-containing protein [Xanthomonadales bacterium]|nr:DUF1684 domain-containing protein [Xanthomonadales bacterium]
MKRLVKNINCLFLMMFLATPVCADQPVDTLNSAGNHKQAIEAWRASRHERLERPNGWLTLIGLEWLKDGENRVGSASDNDIQLTGGPALWGSVYQQGDDLKFVSADIGMVSINGEPLREAEMIADVNGEPTLVAAGTLNFYIIFRGSYGLRIVDTQAIALQQFKGVDNFAIQQDWQIDGRFIKADEGTTIEIANVLGQVSDSAVFGTFEFEADGTTHSLLGLGDADSESLWFIFTDRTSGHGTYGAGRFLYSDGMPENGRLTVDFNKAYNPPCAFNPYSTCPLPPQRNRMDLMVTAGEKDFHPASG